MDITVISGAPDARIAVSGRVDTSTAPELTAFVSDLPGELTGLAVDCSGLEYLSSAGLRALLIAHKRVARAGGRLVLEHVSLAVLDVLTLTGFSGIFDVR